jgi:hypothetical protein
VKPAARVGLVVAGYAAALLHAAAAVAMRLAATRGPDAQAASGMYAFGDLMLFVGAFAVAALLPTAGALLLLRAHRRFWSVLSLTSLAVASTGVAALILYVAGRSIAGPSALGAWAALAVLGVLAAPLLALGFLVAALVAPDRPSRVALGAAAAAELVISACMAWLWLRH